MLKMLHAVTGWVPMLPDPEPNAPAGLKDSASTVISLVKWGSLIAAIGALVSFGMLTLAAEKGGYGGAAANMKERFGTVLIALVVVTNATTLVAWIVL
ncbi:MAG: hypothetical protein ABMA25_29195 [Ilumatobacteraceae bacterium]